MSLGALRRAAGALAVDGSRGAASGSFMTRIADGNLGETLVRRSGVLVGEDGWGNKYYENRGYQVGRHRWVVYADQKGYSPASVPSDWHGWLHNIHDGPPSRKLYLHPAYEATGADGTYGSAAAAGASAMVPGPDVYLPKGAWKAGRRDWTRVQSWVPPQK